MASDRKRVIDVGSHDGRWSFCALRAGAEYVLGLEARAETIAGGVRNFEHYGVASASYDFRAGDADLLRDIDEDDPQGKFDVGLCLGFLYHTIRHFEVIAHLSRLGCSTLIVETNVIANEKAPIVRYRMESAELAHNAYSPVATQRGETISGKPSVPAVVMLLESFGYQAEVMPLGVTERIDGVRDFLDGLRVALLATR